MSQPVFAVILAAGTASRMGELKQVLPLQGKPMLQHVIDKVRGEDFTEVITVLGHGSSQVQEEIKEKDPRFHWVVHPDYKQGQSTSLKCGLETIRNRTDSSSYHVMVFLADLPFLTPVTIHHIYEKGAAIAKSADEPFVVRPSYQGIKGHPVFFGHAERLALETLQGDEGGKPLMAQIQKREFLPVTDEGILLDIDRKEDYAKALKRV
ncbi:nucleotidyltransferase family protein [Bacillus piscicola]|uniref:nucleotidyltransferase family protein n=1 Tax=Bacillus piscicola TaxID=1632684 RepID=UPI001F097CE2|nr:nucleotidyltransferase family protein [Bacillus piscicola]